VQNIDNHDLALFEHLCLEHLGLTFKGNHCNEHNSIKIQYNSHTGYWLKNFNPANGLPDNVNNWGLYDTYHKRKNSPQKPLPKKTKPVPKKGQPKALNPQFYSIYDNKHLLKHLENKTGAKAHFLQKYGIRGVNKMYGYKVSNCIAYASKGGDKFKRPFAAPKNKWRTRKSKVIEYCFGLEQLPEKCKTILIVGGEDDAICINYNLNQYGIYAVNLWSESIAPSIELIDKLKEKSEQVFFFYDADKAGHENSKKFSAQLGVLYVDTRFLFYNLDIDNSIKDFCDVYKNSATYGEKALHYLVSKGIEQTGSILKDKDPFSIEVQNVLQ